MTWKTELSDFTQVKRRFDNFSEIENIKKLELEFLPKIRKYIDDMNSLKESNQECREACV